MWLFFYLYILLAIISVFFEAWVYPFGHPSGLNPAVGQMMLQWHRAAAAYVLRTPLFGSSATPQELPLPSAPNPPIPDLPDFKIKPDPTLDELGRTWKTAAYKPAGVAVPGRVVVTWVAPNTSSPVTTLGMGQDASSGQSITGVENSRYEILMGLTAEELLHELREAAGGPAYIGQVQDATSSACMGYYFAASRCINARVGISGTGGFTYVAPVPTPPAGGSTLTPPVGSIAIVSYAGG